MNAKYIIVLYKHCLHVYQPYKLMISHAAQLMYLLARKMSIFREIIINVLIHQLILAHWGGLDNSFSISTPIVFMKFSIADVFSQLQFVVRTPFNCFTSQIY